MGADDFVVGPGELYVWDFEANNEGTAAVTDVQTFMAAGAGTWYDEVSLTQTTITVGDPLSAVPGAPAFGTEMRLWPNPFNPRTEIAFDLDRDDQILLTVHDIRGRRVAVLHEGAASAGPFSCNWDGLGTDGLAQPGGVYLFNLVTSVGRSATRGVLLK
jgi:hypothetical protein